MIGLNCVGFKVLTAVVMNAATFWDIAPCSPYMKRCFIGRQYLHLKVWKSDEEPTCEMLLGSCKYGFLCGLFSTLKMEVIGSAETSI
jgi:hypothetical protein